MLSSTSNFYTNTFYYFFASFSSCYLYLAVSFVLAFTTSLTSSAALLAYYIFAISSK